MGAGVLSFACAAGLSRWQVVFSTIAQALAPFYQTLEIFFFRLSDFLVQLICGKRGDGAMVDLDGKRQRAASPHASAIPRPRPHRAYFWTCVRVLQVTAWRTSRSLPRRLFIT